MTDTAADREGEHSLDARVQQAVGGKHEAVDR